MYDASVQFKLGFVELKIIHHPTREIILGSLMYTACTTNKTIPVLIQDESIFIQSIRVLIESVKEKYSLNDYEVMYLMNGIVGHHLNEIIDSSFLGVSSN